MRYKKWDIFFGILFLTATIVFIIVFLSNDTFFNWAFNRHLNILSWYIRPLLIIPIVFFAFKRRWSGILGSILLLFTSMFWFPAPEVSSLMAKEFLQLEMDYLQGVWDIQKILISLLVPAFFVLLIISAWKHSFKWLIGTLIGAMLMKVLWSIVFSGNAVISILKPAIAGLIICIFAVWYLIRHKKKGCRK